jgi:hypothetical protein
MATRCQLLGAACPLNHEHGRASHNQGSKSMRRTTSKAPTTIVLPLLCSLLGGCTMRISDFTIVSSRNTLIAEGLPSAPRTQGEDCVPVVFGPLGQPNIEAAIDRALDKAGPQYDVLRDAALSYSNRSFLFGKYCYVIEGTPVSSRKGDAAPGASQPAAALPAK